MTCIELKPCPFCGHVAVFGKDLFDKHYVECSNYQTCPVRPETRVYDTPEAAAAAWNRRAEAADGHDH